uniref:Vascular endothelial growth factor Aa n=1 Tax=Lepisosteus oculatus TaxID=7918 RepID=W5NGF3_LEPOC
TMNFILSIINIVLAALLYLSTVKTAHIPVDGERSPNEVIPFLEVYNRSYCKTRETLVDIFQEYPDEIEYIFAPSCVPLMRCAGCCSDESFECVPNETYNITMVVKKIKPHHFDHTVQMSFTEHRRCECRPKNDVKEKKEKVKGEKKSRKGKGLKRKRKKNRDKKLNSYVSCAFSTPQLHLSISLLIGWGVFVLAASGIQPFCSHCEPCSERRKRLFVQDPHTCKCSCKFSQLHCKSRQLELNERTCRCDKPRR